MSARNLYGILIVTVVTFTLSACDFIDGSNNSERVPTLDRTPPVLTQIDFDGVFTESGVPVGSDEWTADSSPTVKLDSNEAGTATFDGLCGIPSMTEFVSGNNTITFTELADGLYSDCTVRFISETLTLAPFTVDTSAPVLLSNATVSLNEGDTSAVALVYEDAISAASQMTYTFVSVPSSGMLMINDVNVNLGDSFTQSQLTNSALFYKHNGGEDRVDTFTFTVEDFLGNVTDAAAYTINISNVNDAPVAKPDDSYTAERTTIVGFDVLSNDTDEDGDGLIITAATVDNSLGEVNIADDKKTLTFTPNVGQLGEIVVSYTITDRATLADEGSFATSTWTITVGDETPPEVIITFPPSVNASTDRDNITIRGKASDLSEINALSVNGINVSSTDNFASWDVTVPLDPGTNSLMLEASDSVGNTILAAAETTVIRSLNWVSPVGVALDDANNRVLVIDDSINTLFSMELDTGVLSVVSDSSTGTGPNIYFPSSVALDTKNNRALITDRTLNALLAVDLISGDRTVLSSVSIGGGPVFSWPRSVAFDSLGNRALVVDPLLKALIAVDLNNGTRVVISDNNGIGNGLEFAHLTSVVFDDRNNRALILDDSRNGLFGVDLVTGDRTLLSGRASTGADIIGTGPGLPNPQGLTFDAANNRALVISPLSSYSTLTAVDLTTGDRTILADNRLASGPDFYWPQALVLDAGNNRVLLADARRSELITVNLTTGSSGTASNSTVGAGPKFTSLQSLSLDAVNKRAAVSDRYRSALMSVDLMTGNRSIVSRRDIQSVQDNDKGEGTGFMDLKGVAIDIDQNRILAISTDDEDYFNALVTAVDLESGDREVISDTNTVGTTIGPGTEEYWFFPQVLAPNLVNNSLVVAVYSVLFIVNLDTGDRVILSSNGDFGEGPNLGRIYSISLDVMNNRALLVDKGLKAIFEVDLDTGVRAVVSASNIGVGPEFNSPVSLAWDANNNRVVVADDGYLGLYSVSMNSGDRTIVSGENIGNGPNIDCPVSVVLDSVNNHALVADDCLNAVFAVHLGSGDRVIISR